jgi:hypothetical protein
VHSDVAAGTVRTAEAAAAASTPDVRAGDVGDVTGGASPPVPEAALVTAGSGGDDGGAAAGDGERLGSSIRYWASNDVASESPSRSRFQHWDSSEKLNSVPTRPFRLDSNTPRSFTTITRLRCFNWDASRAMDGRGGRSATTCRAEYD